MKIFPKIGTVTKIGAALIGGSLIFSAPKIQSKEFQDRFESTLVIPEGNSTKTVLKNAPNPSVTIAGEKRNAIIVVNLTDNILYKYDRNGKAECAYLVASGKKSSPTHTGIRIVTHTETFPYRTAPRTSKRRRNPRNYGPKIICVNKINRDGIQSSTGEFIHGNNDYDSLGEYVSMGCIRMDNDVITELSKQVKRGDIIIIKK